jgi:hypothetical protein
MTKNNQLEQLPDTHIWGFSQRNHQLAKASLNEVQEISD